MPKKKYSEKDLDVLWGKTVTVVINFMKKHKLSRKEKSELLEYIGTLFDSISTNV